jgi:hypothetical protein
MATRSEGFAAADIRPNDVESWRTLRTSLEKRREPPGPATLPAGLRCLPRQARGAATQAGFAVLAFFEGAAGLVEVAINLVQHPAWARGPASVEGNEVVLDGSRAERYLLHEREQVEQMAFDLAAMAFHRSGRDPQQAVAFGVTDCCGTGSTSWAAAVVGSLWMIGGTRQKSCPLYFSRL